MTATTSRFIQFITSVQHSYFKKAADSSFVESTTRIIYALEKEKIYITVVSAVKLLEALSGRFESAAVLETDLSIMSTADLERINESFKTNFQPTTDRPGSRKLIADILGKGPEATVKGGVIPPGTKLLDWMDNMTLEAFTIEAGMSSVRKYTDEQCHFW